MKYEILGSEFFFYHEKKFFHIRNWFFQHFLSSKSKCTETDIRILTMKPNFIANEEPIKHILQTNIYGLH